MDANVNTDVQVGLHARAACPCLLDQEGAGARAKVDVRNAICVVARAEKHVRVAGRDGHAYVQLAAFRAYMLSVWIGYSSPRSGAGLVGLSRYVRIFRVSSTYT